MCGPNLIFLIEFDGLLFIPENPSAGTTSDHAEVVVLEGDNVLHLVGGQVQLDAVVHLWTRREGWVLFVRLTI